MACSREAGDDPASKPAALLLAASLSIARAQSTESYGVFCASGRVEIDSRSDAEHFARRNFRGVGASCACR
jgi:hypothetical protein